MTTETDILIKARELLARPGGWTRGALARAGRFGDPVAIGSPKATGFCLSGALMQAAEAEAEYADSTAIYRAACARVLRVLPLSQPLTVFNDRPKTRKKDVLAVLDKAIAYGQGPASDSQD
jgi:hypothetical protein